ncbi:GtrA family protein [Aeromicrobium sp. UC242_57]|uniref:GtrA family protein n=1 Tax=Aeromicrobium sp. UC242_57 TaxID=3374624 RepID=UPI00378F2666
MNFLLSRYWTFEVAHVSSGAQLRRYGLLVAVNYVVTVGAVTGLHHVGLDVFQARTLTLVALTASTYFLYRNWVFASR